MKSRLSGHADVPPPGRLPEWDELSEPVFPPDVRGERAWHRRDVLFLGCVGGLIAAVGCGRADAPPTVERVRELVERLVSTQKSPLLKRISCDLPQGVSHDELSQERRRMIPIYEELSDSIEVALPILIEHAYDERFSHIGDALSCDCYYSRSVGDTCTELIERHVEVYQPYTLRYDIENRSESLYFIRYWLGVATWAKMRRGIPLFELQIEALAWAWRQPCPLLVPRREWAKSRDEIERLVVQLRTTGKPLLRKHTLNCWPK